ncbi:LOW QUALITY PROTEIN: gamma-glutamylaminecyclotransferase [Kogia breviceps]|uniref:LOW QUALITY PROTEIN: gamma-glutamylaminecyclotransferase n=1 Tax=Kogia breviceps TaxID=27615 RepID=UPI0034D2794B
MKIDNRREEGSGILEDDRTETVPADSAASRHRKLKPLLGARQPAPRTPPLPRVAVERPLKEIEHWLLYKAALPQGLPPRQAASSDTSRSPWNPAWEGCLGGSGARGEAARFPAAGDLCVRPHSLAAPGRAAHVFAFGTLRTGRPNHRVLLEGTHGRAVEPHPLVIAGQRDIPRLLNLPGRGRRVAGEVDAVDEPMLRFLDEFEGCPDTYQHTRATVAVEGAGGTLPCSVSSTATYPPEWVHLLYRDDYDSQGAHGLRFRPRESRREVRGQRPPEDPEPGGRKMVSLGPHSPNARAREHPLKQTFIKNSMREGDGGGSVFFSGS